MDNLIVKNMRACTVEKMKGEVLALIDAGKIPNTVKSFSDLHDYIDANELGGFCEDEFADPLIRYFGGRDLTGNCEEDEGAMPDDFLHFMNDCQDDIHKWIEGGGLTMVTVPNKSCSAMITIPDRRKGQRRKGQRRVDFSDDNVRDDDGRRDGEERRMIGGSGAFINPRNMGHGYSVKHVWDEYTHDAVLLRDGRYIAITTGQEQYMQLSVYRDEDHFNEEYSSTVPLATILINEDGHIDVSYDNEHREVEHEK